MIGHLLALTDESRGRVADKEAVRIAKLHADRLRLLAEELHAVAGLAYRLSLGRGKAHAGIE